MSFQARRELTKQVAPRYREADRRQKTIILDEFLAATGYARKYALRLLGSLPGPSDRIRRPREGRYNREVQEALAVAWSAANSICAKRLVPFLPELVPVLERHGHLMLTDEIRGLLLSMSPATADRLLRPYRPEGRRHGISTTRPGSLLKHQVAVRIFSEWDDAAPGFMEADLVAHCGGNMANAFLHTLVLTDVATGWTECLPLLYRTQEAVVDAIGQARLVLPFPLLGLDTDNGSEFLNQELLNYCEGEGITYTRGRAYKKNDQCYVEQKNGSIVRQFIGYDRFGGARAYRQLAEVYRAIRLYVNFFQPSMKLREKTRNGQSLNRKYDTAQTPFQRLLASGALGPETRSRLEDVYKALDPVHLLRQIETLQKALWRHVAIEGTDDNAAASPTAFVSEAGHPVRFDAGVHEGGGNRKVAQHDDESPKLPSAEKYRRYRKPRAPRTWRTRPDPFADVWKEIQRWLEGDPDRTARSLLQDLQRRYPGRYPQSLLRTLQRRVKEWRARSLVRFDDDAAWLCAGLSDGGELPRPLRATTESHESAEPALAR